MQNLLEQATRAVTEFEKRVKTLERKDVERTEENKRLKERVAKLEEQMTRLLTPEGNEVPCMCHTVSVACVCMHVCEWVCMCV